jgi:hypothetical protein
LSRRWLIALLYCIHITPIDDFTELYIAERVTDYFVVKSKDGKDVKFCWQISAIRKGYDNKRLEKIQP